MTGVKKRSGSPQHTPGLLVLIGMVIVLNLVAIIFIPLVNGDPLPGPMAVESDSGDGDSEFDRDDAFMCCFLAFVSLGCGILVARWMGKDAQKRQEEGMIYIIVLLALSFCLPFVGIAIGVLIWLLVRPDWSLVEQSRRMGGGQYQPGYPQQPYVGQPQRPMYPQQPNQPQYPMGDTRSPPPQGDPRQQPPRNPDEPHY
jgi:hypothetical protein